MSALLTDAYLMFVLDNNHNQGLTTEAANRERVVRFSVEVSEELNAFFYLN